MFIEFCPRLYIAGGNHHECWIAYETPIFSTHTLSIEERVRWEWGEACWTSRILAEGEEASIALRQMWETV